MMETSYDENGVRIRQKSRVNTQRQRSNLFTGATPMWMAGLDVYYRAPEAEFSTWEPVLSGLLDSMKMNPAWQMAERQRMQNQIMTTQMDTSRRLRQISQTLSETSDIINNSYWN